MMIDLYSCSIADLLILILVEEVSHEFGQSLCIIHTNRIVQWSSDSAHRPVHTKRNVITPLVWKQKIPGKLLILRYAYNINILIFVTQCKQFLQNNYQLQFYSTFNNRFLTWKYFKLNYCQEIINRVGLAVIDYSRWRQLNMFSPKEIRSD